MRDVRFLGFAILLAAGGFTTAACGGATATNLDGDDGGPSPDTGTYDASARDAHADHVAPGDDDEDAQPPARAPKKHRPSATACSHDRGPGQPAPTFDAGIHQGCSSDADCTQGTNGRCGYNGPVPVRACSYDSCFADSDCGTNVCSCGQGSPRTAANRCLGGNCQVDSDCGAQGFCSPTVGLQDCSNAPGAYYCHTKSDACIDDEDCKDFEWCGFDTTASRWACTPQFACAGVDDSSGH